MVGSGSKYKTRFQITDSALVQNRYNDTAKADKVIDGMIPAPDSIIADATTAVYVGKGALLRVAGNGTAYLSFGDSSVAVPSVSTVSILTPNGFFFTVASDDYVRTSAAIRIEVTID